MTLTNILTGLPSLSSEAPKDSWHTGNPETDPWCWKDRAAEEKRLAYGCILGGHKGFVSPRMYSIFYTAYHPEELMEERRESGQISQTIWQLWQLFEEKTLLSTSDIRKEMGVTRNMIGICLSYKQSNTSKIDRQEHQKTPKKINPPYFCSIARIESVLRFKTDGKRTKNHKYKE
jgi:hypothetical protein